VIQAQILGNPVPFARPRFSGKRAYQAPVYAAWKAGAALQLRAAARGQSFARQPLALEVNVYHPRPATRPAHADRPIWSAGGCCYAITRSDLDNHIKAVCDALQDAGIIADDRWIVHIVAWSWYAPTLGPVGVGVTLAPLLGLG